MTSKNVSRVETILKTHRLCLQKLVQRVIETPMREQWVEDCMVAFGWTREYTEDVIDGWRKSANLELRHYRDELEL